MLTFAVACLVISFLFSGSETALTTSSRAAMLRLDRQGNKDARVVNRLLTKREQLIGALLIGNNVANIAGSTLATGLFLSWFGDVGVIYATVVMTVLVVVFCEVLPKTAAFSAPDRFALAGRAADALGGETARPGAAVHRVAGQPDARLVGFKVGEMQPILSGHDELRGTVDLLHHEGSFEKRDRDMLGGLLDLRDLTVGDVMIHRTEMITYNADDPPEKIVDTILNGPVTRVPTVARHARKHHRHRACARHPARHASGRRRRQQDRSRRDRHAAVVRAEYPPAVGAARRVPPPQDAARARRRRIRRGDGCSSRWKTFIEEIVGDIADEYEVELPGVRPQPDGSVNVDGSVPIRDLNRAMDWHLPDDEATTIAGLVIHEARSIPEAGQSFTFYGFRFNVMRKNRNRITALRITPLTRQKAAS